MELYWNLEIKIKIMFKKLKNYFKRGLIGLSLLPSFVLAQYGLEETGESAGLTSGEATPLPQLIGNYIQIFLSLLGVIFLIHMIYGGFKWMKARGNAPEVEKAKEVIISAVIGLVIIAGSYAITAFVISAVAK